MAGAKQLITDFLRGRGETVRIDHEVLSAPHSRPSLPLGMSAVYVFSLSEAYGKTCPAGPNRVLKVGMVGPKSNARFMSQHYNPDSAGSTLAGSLIDLVEVWPYLGIRMLDGSSVALWVEQHTDRDHFLLDASHSGLLPRLEKYLRARLGSMFG